ncbi:MAG: chitobiase/beta-hexosaminidase C-terminal domain-containing protein, partial [Cyclobacteriaceae bacterium]|nr:chitobiase/beta-hexosaminidase C-terminal domain-containing protein [Cyclobacteriaceae bacterium]
AEGKSLAEFTNLEKLNLNKTKVSGKIVSDLKKLKKLRSLSVAGTSVNAASLEEITSLPELKEIFVWNTAVTQSEFQSLEKKYPNIRWDFGYQSNETLRLTPPILLNDSLLIKEGQFIRLKHNLPGTIIRYTLDGSKPDTLTSPEYKGPIPIDRYTRMNTIACREGWWASQSVEFIFFKSGHKPSSVELLTAPEKDYPGEGGKTLTDFTKGNVDILKTGNVWLGFRYKPFEALFTFEKNPGIREVTVSYGENVYAYLVPPESIELWAGKTKDRLQLVSKVVPAQPTKAGATQVKGIVFSVAGKDFTCFKLIARPVAKLPEFISKKREKGWFFVDEVLFN